MFFNFQVRSQTNPYFTYVDPNTRTLDKTNAKVGTLPGILNVNSLGAATYEIPIVISPGTAGMQPGISLVYSNLIKDGILGIGWYISGLSEIKRVSQNFYHDGNITGVRLQNTDRFALDSNRLILTAGTSYGADNSEYKPEVETFVKVIAHGVAGTGPSWFEVKTKDGKTLEYGNTADSKVEAYGSSTVYKWRINKVRDIDNNSMNFIYNELNGESYIARIDYTINAATGLTAYNSLKFSYYSTSRSDLNTIYVAGSQVPSTKLLYSIRMETESGALVREYQFKYDNLRKYSHLNQITEYGSNGTYYLNSTIIGWGDFSTYLSTQADAFNNGVKNKYYHGDFNGDGRTDFVVTPNKTAFTTSDKWKLYFANSDGLSFQFKNEGYLDTYFKGFFVADVNGDGTDEIYWRKLETISYNCNPHPCPTLVMTSDSLTAESDSLLIESADTLLEMETAINGDGSILAIEPPPSDTCWDICYKYNVKYLYWYNNGTTGLIRGSSSYDLNYDNAPSDLYLMSADLDGNGKTDFIAMTSAKNIYRIDGITCSSYPGFGSPNDVRIMDFNGNGKKDLLAINGSNSTIYEFNTLTSQFASIYTSSTYPTTSDRIFPGDFNGDRNTDLLSWKSGTGWSLKLSTGTSFTASIAPALINVDPDLSVADNNYYIGDFNGDKKDDVLEVYKNSTTSKLKVFYNFGGGTYVSEINEFPKSSVNQDFFSLGDFNGDGQKDISYYDYNLTTNYVRIALFHKDEKKDMVSCIANGLNHKTRIFWERLNAGGTFYTKGAGAQFPVTDYSGAYYAVWYTEESNGVSGGMSVTSYNYEKLRLHKQGKGSLGFWKVTTTDDEISFRSVKEYTINNDFFFSYLSKITLSLESGPQIKQDIYSWSTKSLGNKRFIPYKNSSFSYDNLKDFTINEVFDYNNNYGNLTTYSFESRSGSQTEFTKTEVFTYGSYGSYDNIPNKILTYTLTSVYTGQPSYSRTKSFTYDSSGHLLTEKSDPSTTKETIKTYSQFSSYGLPLQVTLSGSDVTSRTTVFEYDPKYRFIKKVTNPAGHYISKTFDPGTGNVLTETNIINKTTTYQYDVFGRLTQTILPTLKKVNNSIGWDNSLAGGSNSLYYQSVTPDATTPGIPDAYTYYDLLGREIFSSKEGPFNLIYQKKVYNTDGTLNKISWPYKTGETEKWIAYSYDNYGREISENNNGLTTTISYNLGSTTVTNPGNQVKTTKVNSAGDVIRVTENNGNLIDYLYHSSGQVKSITSAGTTITINYDSYGRQQSIVNPNNGNTKFEYNVFDELTKQTDSRNISYVFTYNNLGQLITKVGSGTEGTTTYAYYTSGNGLEQIQSVTGPNGVSNSYTYDSYGRMNQLTETISGDQSFVTGFAFDDWNNNTSITYPSGITLTNTFNTDGYQTEIRNAGTLVWKLDNITSLGQPDQYSLGTSGLKTNFLYTSNGFVNKITTGIGEQTFNFDANTGNLTSRSYKKTNNPATVSESFTYDNLNRLCTYQVSGQTGYSAIYSNNGNITSKTDAGSYTYDPTKLNAVASVTNPLGIIPTNEQKIDYTGFNKAYHITDGTYVQDITYGPDNQRIKSVLKNNGTVIKTKYYAPGYEKEIKPGVTRELHYVSCPYGLVAVLIKQGGTTTTYFTETDHLGSITGLMDANGTYVEQFSYDPWGRRRNPTNWTYTSVPQPVLIDRGFTGHEHYDNFGLIDMNGRMYDAVLGRFLGVDQIIQDAGNSQSINGYGYCLNNPLKYIDPSGYVRKAYNSTSINPAYFATFLQALANGSSLNDAVSCVPHVSQTCYYDDETGAFEFWMDWSGSSEGATSGFGPEGYYGLLTPAEIYSKKVTVNLLPYQFNSLQDNYFAEFERNPNSNPTVNDNWALKAQTGIGAFGFGHGAKEELINYAAKMDASINELGYVKAVKVIGKSVFAAQTVISGVQVYNAWDSNNSNKWGVTAKAGLDVTFGAIALWGGPIGWAIGGVYFVGDIVGWWGDWGKPAPASYPRLYK